MPTIIYISGKGRSGSTLLDRLAGQIDGVFSAGELWRLWHVDDPAAHLCGCGQALGRCPVWSRVLAALHDRGIDRASVRRDQEQLYRWPVALRLVLSRRRADNWSPMVRYVAVMQQVYSILAELTQSQAVVDSSKWPLDPILVSRNHDLDVRLVHLVRDVRAVAYSWRRVKHYRDEPDHRPMPRFGTLHSVASWTVRNLATELVAGSRPAIRMRYEDLVADPETELRRLAAHAGLQFDGLSMIGESVDMAATHTVAGNPDRMDRGPVSIRPDTAWADDMPAGRRRIATSLGWPLLLRYGYVRLRKTHPPRDNLVD